MVEALISMNDNFRNFHIPTFSDDKMEKMLIDEHVALLSYFYCVQTKQFLNEPNDVYNCDSKIVAHSSMVQSLIWINISFHWRRNMIKLFHS